MIHFQWFLRVCWKDSCTLSQQKRTTMQDLNHIILNIFLSKADNYTFYGNVFVLARFLKQAPAIVSQALEKIEQLEPITIFKFSEGHFIAKLEEGLGEESLA